MALVSAMLLLLFGGFFAVQLWGINEYFLMGWSYYVFVEYLFLSIIFFELVSRKFPKEGDFKNFCYMVFTLIAIGFIYECPIMYNKMGYFFSMPPFVRTQLLILPLLVWKFKPYSFVKKSNLVMLVFLIGFSIFYHFVSVPAWIARLPTACYWFTIVWNVEP